MSSVCKDWICSCELNVNTVLLQSLILIKRKEEEILWVMQELFMTWMITWLTSGSKQNRMYKSKKTSRWWKIPKLSLRVACIYSKVVIVINISGSKRSSSGILAIHDQQSWHHFGYSFSEQKVLQTSWAGYKQTIQVVFAVSLNPVYLLLQLI